MVHMKEGHLWGSVCQSLLDVRITVALVWMLMIINIPQVLGEAPNPALLASFCLHLFMFNSEQMEQ